MALCMSLKDNDSVYFVEDGFFLYTKSNIKNENNVGIWGMDDTKHTLFMCYTDFSKISYLKRMNLANARDEQEGINKDYCLKVIVPTLMCNLQKAGMANSEDGKVDNLDICLVVASNNRAFFIGSKATCRELGDFEAFSGGPDFLHAANDELKDVPILDRIALLTFLNDRYNSSVIYPICVKDTKSMQTIFMDQDEVYSIAHNYFKGGII